MNFLTLDERTNRDRSGGAVTLTARRVSAPMSDMVRAVTRSLDAAQGAAPLAAIATVLQSALHRPGLVGFDDLSLGGTAYVRQMIHVDPMGRFSVLALAWPPGAKSSVHGHRAWGVVGVYQGEIGIESYIKRSSVKGGYAIVKNGESTARAGRVSAVGPDPEGIHRLFNDSAHPAFSVHIYGMDLSQDPMAINIVYAD